LLKAVSIGFVFLHLHELGTGVALLLGRPKGSKHALSEEFIAALCDDFKQHGATVIEKVREEKPADYLRVVASVVPKDITVNSDDPYGDMTDEELRDTLARVRTHIAEQLGLMPSDGGGGSSSVN
jgi:hypothetical protein